MKKNQMSAAEAFEHARRMDVVEDEMTRAGTMPMLVISGHRIPGHQTVIVLHVCGNDPGKDAVLRVLQTCVEVLQNGGVYPMPESQISEALDDD
jgi:hypothetical protein